MNICNSQMPSRWPHTTWQFAELLDPLRKVEVARSRANTISCREALEQTVPRTEVGGDRQSGLSPQERPACPQMRIKGFGGGEEFSTLIEKASGGKFSGYSLCEPTA